MSEIPTMTDIRRMHRKYLKPIYKKAFEKALNAATAYRSKYNEVLTDEEIAHIRRETREEVRARKEVMSLRQFAASKDLSPVIENAHQMANPKKHPRPRLWRTNAQRKGKAKSTPKKSPLQEMLENN